MAAMHPLLLSILAAAGAAAAEAPPQAELQPGLPLLELPFNLGDGYQAPGMQQSLALAWSVDRMAVAGIQRAWEALVPDNEGLRTGLGIATAGAASGGLIFVGAWMHEEWHRAVMTGHGIDSRNGFYHAEAWSSGTISVDRVADEDLSRLKAEHPADMVRLMSAGMESEQALVRLGGDELFFHGGAGRTLGPFYTAESWMAPLLLFTEISPIAYLATCTSGGMDALNAEENARQDDPLQRDFTGPDCSAWVHDLFHPDEPYEARGPHPSGVGVDRYIDSTELSAEEMSYLKQRLGLQLLNLLNPHLYGINGVALGDHGERWIAHLGHSLTPWGSSIDARASLRRRGRGGTLVLRNGLAQHGWFPGLGLELVDRGLPVAGLVLDGGLDLWLQPRDLRHDARQRQPGGRVHGRLAYRALPQLDLWLGASAKTEGWVMGELSLQPGVTGSLGLSAQLGER
jgi:hypothetical protein